MIELKELEKEYTDIKIGKINVSFPKAGFISIIGANGAGKSTMLNIMGRLLNPNNGKVLVDNIDIHKESSDAVAKILTILKQENSFVTKLTIKQLVSFGRYPYSKGNISKFDEEIVDRYINFFGLKEIENKYISELSGGQRQRAYIAMVLSQETEYIFLDEPLNNLDISKSIEMMQYLKKACEDFQKTIIAVMHDINFAMKYSDYICAMKDGQIVSFGKTEDVINKKLLSTIYGADIDIIKTNKGNFIYF